VFLNRFLFIVENEGPMITAEAKYCDKQNYSYCDENCIRNCPRKYGPKAIGFCTYNPPACICRFPC